MAPVGLLRLGETLVGAAVGNPSPLLTPAIYVYVYVCFVVLALSFAITAWRTRNLERPSIEHPSISQGAPS